ncbi:phage tail protein [Flindersiella endophytica]
MTQELVNGRSNGRTRYVGRGLVPGLSSPHNLIEALPGIYQEQDFTERFVSAFDEALAPVYATLDNLDSYFDPKLTPPDFLAWLGSWIGMVEAYTPTVELRRRLVARAAELHKWQGTLACVRELIRLATGLDPEVIESGGTRWSPQPNCPPPGDPRPSLIVRLRVPAERAIDPRRLDALIRASKPAHIPHRLDIEVQR